MYNIAKNKINNLIILALFVSIAGCARTENDMENDINAHSITVEESEAPHFQSSDTAVPTDSEITESTSLASEASEAFDNEVAQSSGNFVDDLRNVIVSADSVEELESKIKEFDSENRIDKVCVYRHVRGFINDEPLTSGDLDYQQVLYVQYDNDKTYITSYRDVQDCIAETTMFSAIIARADTIEQLVMEAEGWDIDNRLTGISIYSGYREAWGTYGGDNPTSVIMENGQWVVTEGDWRPIGAIRVTYDDGISWFSLHHKGEIA